MSEIEAATRSIFGFPASYFLKISFILLIYELVTIQFGLQVSLRVRSSFTIGRLYGCSIRQLILRNTLFF